MPFIQRSAQRLLLAATFLAVTPVAAATGDLLIAPTRLVLEDGRGGQVILNNIGDAPATYRISLQLERMNDQHGLDDIDEANATPTEKAALAMISYAPRRIVLAPNQPQAIRVGARFPDGLPDGEYRAHMLFRAVPDAKPQPIATQVRPGLSIAITPLYGIAIPVIVRKGALTASVAIADVHRCPATAPAAQPAPSPVSPPPPTIRRAAGALCLTLTRDRTRSTYGTVRVSVPGIAKPMIEAVGVGVYTEVSRIRLAFDVDAATLARLTGAVKVEYVAAAEAGGATLAQTTAMLR